MADRDFILDQEAKESCLTYTQKILVQSAMDEYMKATCLELLEYMAKNQVQFVPCSIGWKYLYNGELLTKEQLFENFL